MIKTAGLLILLTAVLACAPFGSQPIDKKYYDFPLEKPSVYDANLGVGAPVLVRDFDMAPAFDSHAFIYRISEKEYIGDYYHEFVSFPARLITDQFTSRLFSTAQFSSAGTVRQLDIAYRLSGEITRLYADLLEKKRPRAVLAIQLILERRSGQTFSIVHSSTYTTATDIPSQGPDDLVDGWNQGLATIFNRFMEDVVPLL